jgi:hypothetical protein
MRFFLICFVTLSFMKTANVMAQVPVAFEVTKTQIPSLPAVASMLENPLFAKKIAPLVFQMPKSAFLRLSLEERYAKLLARPELLTLLQEEWSSYSNSSLTGKKEEQFFKILRKKIKETPRSPRQKNEAPGDITAVLTLNRTLPELARREETLTTVEELITLSSQAFRVLKASPNEMASTWKESTFALERIRETDRDFYAEQVAPLFQERSSRLPLSAQEALSAPTHWFASSDNEGKKLFFLRYPSNLMRTARALSIPAFVEGDLSFLLAAPHLNSIRFLKINHRPLSLANVRLFIENPSLAFLKGLHLENAQLTDQHLYTLMAGKNFIHIDDLNIANNPHITEEALLFFFLSPYSASIKTIDLRGLPLTPEFFQELNQLLLFREAPLRIIPI